MSCTASRREMCLICPGVPAAAIGVYVEVKCAGISSGNITYQVSQYIHTYRVDVLSHNIYCCSVCKISLSANTPNQIKLLSTFLLLRTTCNNSIGIFFEGISSNVR
mgnify:CR=1 FL=1